MWFDYRKAFHSVPHPWIIKGLELAKVPNKIIIAVRNIMDQWATKVNLFTNNSSIETNSINYITGVLQGDCLSLILFILSVNPLSVLLSLFPGYNIAKTNNNKQKLTHLFFADDLKTFARNKKEATLQLDLITQFKKDIDMKFGLDKCADIYIVQGIQKFLDTKLSINGTIKKNSIPEKLIIILGKMKILVSKVNYTNNELQKNI